LFGAVMQKIGTSINNALPHQYQSPQRTKSTAAANLCEENSATASMGGIVKSFLGGDGGGPSPSGKTIMDIVNNFNSPFRFQSPQKKKRRRLLSSPPFSKSDNAFNTPSPTKKRRLRLDSDVIMDHSNLSASSSSNRFLFHTNHQDDSRSSLEHSNLSEASASNWREIPIVEDNDNATPTGSRMEILDWSLPSRLMLELHVPKGGGEAEIAINYWSLQREDGWNAALSYWEFRCLRRKQPNTEGTSWEWPAKGMDFLRRGGSIGASRGATSSMLDFSKQASILPPASNHTTVSKLTNPNSAKELAKRLIQSVRGPDATMSKKQLPDDGWQDYDGEFSTETRQWQRAFQSLFQNFIKRIRESEVTSARNTIDINSSMMGTYFYVFGTDHMVLFRVAWKIDSGTLEPSVVVSRTNATFRDTLQKHGVAAIELLETAEDQQARENLSSAANNKTLFSGDKPANHLLSPSVNAELEALRRAQAFGESAGADVYVKIKKPRQSSVLSMPHRHEAMRLCGWDDVRVFFEVYLNTLGNISPSFSIEGTQPLPTLMCHHAMGPFENSSIRSLGIFPSSPEAEEGSSENTGQDSSTCVSFEIRGSILPSVARELLMVGRNCLLKDEANRPSVAADTDDASRAQDLSRYIVLKVHKSTKTKRRSYDRAKDSLVLNQGKAEGKHSKTLLECSIGKSVTMAVWDSSRQDVVACKLEDDHSIL
jgi:hypothetical protein